MSGCMYMCVVWGMCVCMCLYVMCVSVVRVFLFMVIAN